MTDTRHEQRLETVVTKLAPGTVLRRGVERILRAHSGGLVVLGDSPELRMLLSGGFRIDVLLTEQRLSELAKMDGAIILDATAQTILWVNVHLMPDRSIPTAESGTRHRTAERVARQTGLPVISISQSMHIVTLYTTNERHVLPDVAAVYAQADHALQAVERYRQRFDEAVASLDAMEVSDQVNLGDVLHVIVRGELLGRLAGELERQIAELGVEGRLLRLQADELLAGADHERRLLIRDYLGRGIPEPEPPLLGSGGSGDVTERVLDALAELSHEDLLEPSALARTLGLSGSEHELETPVAPRGLRVLGKVPRLSERSVANLVEHFGSLPRVLAAGPEELDEVDGVGSHRAKLLRDGLARLAELGPGKYYV